MKTFSIIFHIVLSHLFLLVDHETFALFACSRYFVCCTQVEVFEGLLPAYYNHKNFLSFVRQLNFYGESVRGAERGAAACERAQLRLL